MPRAMAESCAPTLVLIFFWAQRPNGAAGTVHQADHCAEDNQKDQDADVIAVGQHTDKSVFENMHGRSFKGKTGV